MASFRWFLCFSVVHVFPTKEDVVLRDEFDPHIFQVFMAQPAGLSSIQALRVAFREVLA